MRVLVTGGTGFVGSHCAAELVRHGFEVRLLVRNPDRIAPAFEPLGIEPPPHSVGDVTDRASVERAAQGCDAILHAASVYSLDGRDAEIMRRVNVEGTDTVLRVACERGFDPIVYVSSYVVLLPTEANLLSVSEEVKHPRGAYSASKADAERIARALQEEGAPVAIGYPGVVFGPNDPHFGESTRLVRDILSRKFPMIPRGGLSIVDVRDLAEAFARMFSIKRGLRRYLLGGTRIAFADLIDTMSELTGRKIFRLTLPPWSMRPAVRAAGLLQRVLPLRLPVSQEGFDAIAWDVRTDDSASVADLGFAPRDLRETLVDTCQWAFRAGHITKKQAGRLVAQG
ncbi:MAG: NAD-dependent epimerase/dehydratase family protein [Pararhodobacter sp.]|nr:NAD-dependent epimerase/dehydratase family protein [Pararhodobacter sp.]